MHLSKFDSWPESLKLCVVDYLDHPTALLGSGPWVLGRRIFGDDCTQDDFQWVCAKVRCMAARAVLTYEGAQISIKSLTDPQQQSMWCKMVGAFGDYASQTLGQHMSRSRQT